MRTVTLGRLVVVPLVSPATATWLGKLAAVVARADGGTVVPISVVTPSSTEEAAAQARVAVDRAARAALDHGADSRADVVTGQRVPTAVVDAVDDLDASLVMMGWQGRSTTHNIFGELIDSVIGRSNVPLAVVRPAEDPYGRVLVPVSDDHLGDAGQRGVSLATQLAERLSRDTDSSLVVVHVGEESTQLPPELAQASGAMLRMDGPVAQAVAQVARPDDIVVTPVAPTGDGLRNATTHLAWATPRS